MFLMLFHDGLIHFWVYRCLIKCLLVMTFLINLIHSIERSLRIAINLTLIHIRYVRKTLICIWSSRYLLDNICMLILNSILIYFRNFLSRAIFTSSTVLFLVRSSKNFNWRRSIHFIFSLFLSKDLVYNVFNL